MRRQRHDRRGAWCVLYGKAVRIWLTDGSVGNLSSKEAWVRMERCAANVKDQLDGVDITAQR